GAIANSLRKDLHRIPKFPRGGFYNARNASLPRQPETMLSDGPQRRIEFGENEADPLVAFRAFERSRRRQKMACRELLRQVHADGRGLRDDGTVVIEHWN